MWGTAIGAMFGYGASPAGRRLRAARTTARRSAGSIGYNVGLAAAAAGLRRLRAELEPARLDVGRRGIGAAVSLPVFLFYAGDGGPPAKRGFLFTATATTLGIAAGAIFASGAAGDYQVGENEDEQTPGAPTFARLTTITPMAVPGGGGHPAGRPALLRRPPTLPSVGRAASARLFARMATIRYYPSDGDAGAAWRSTSR